MMKKTQIILRLIKIFNTIQSVCGGGGVLVFKPLLSFVIFQLVCHFKTNKY